MSDDQLDEEILRHMKDRWQKVAMIIAKVGERTGSSDHERTASRIAVLVDTGKLESVGDIGNWRFSEVRLPVK